MPECDVHNVKSPQNCQLQMTADSEQTTFGSAFLWEYFLLVHCIYVSYAPFGSLLTSEWLHRHRTNTLTPQLRIHILTQTNTYKRFDLEFEPILFAYKRHKIFWLGVFFFCARFVHKNTYTHTQPAHKPARSIAIWMWMFTFFYMFFLADEIQLFHSSEFLCWTLLPKNRFSFAILILARNRFIWHDAGSFQNWLK